MEINSITNGIVIDHIRAGFGKSVLDFLDVDTGLGSVALIMNVESRKHGRKDLIKLQNVEHVDVNVLGLIDNTATVIYIRNEKIVKKVKLSYPQKVTNVLKCKNPRCITSVEPLNHVFHWWDNLGRYRCEYCDTLQKFEVDDNK